MYCADQQVTPLLAVPAVTPSKPALNGQSEALSPYLMIQGSQYLSKDLNDGCTAKLATL
jgi:hypothetical protein